MAASNSTAIACASIAALSLSACTSDEMRYRWPPVAASAVPTDAEMQAYVAQNWSRYEEDLRRTAKLAPGQLQFVGVSDVRCRADFGRMICNYQVAARTPSGELAQGRLEGFFENKDGKLDEYEVIYVG